MDSENKIYKSFTDLEVWKESRDFKNHIYAIVKNFPSSEKYNLESQITRSVRSIGANIAEGYGRFTYKDQVHFCIQARGSLFETINHIIDAFDCEYINEITLEDSKQRAAKLEKLLNGYISWLKKMMVSKD